MKLLAKAAMHFAEFLRQLEWIAKSIPCRWRYAALGALLGLGSPYGLVCLRSAYFLQDAFFHWWALEWTAMRPVYIYAGVGTVTIFTIFGYVLGKKEDALRKHAQAVENSARSFQQISITDGITKLYSHSYLITRLEEEFARARRYQYPLGCLFIDIDDFKRVNDVYGHLFGDEVLLSIARVLASQVRDTDVPGRYGGDEFMILLPETPAPAAFQIAERIRFGVERINFDSQEKFKTSVSVGVYAADAGTGSFREIIELADSALHKAKHEGKNRSIMVK